MQELEKPSEVPAGLGWSKAPLLLCSQTGLNVKERLQDFWEPPDRVMATKPRNNSLLDNHFRNFQNLKNLLISYSFLSLRVKLELSKLILALIWNLMTGKKIRFSHGHNAKKNGPALFIVCIYGNLRTLKCFYQVVTFFMKNLISKRKKISSLNDKVYSQKQFN